MIWGILLSILLTLSACAETKVKRVFELKTVICPVEPPNVVCQSVSKQTLSLRELGMYRKQLEFQNAQCVDALQAWESEYSGCVKEFQGDSK